MSIKYVLILCKILLFVIISNTTAVAKPTAKKCIFVYFSRNFKGAVIDSIARKYDLIVLQDNKRWSVPVLRKKAISWRQKRPLILLYKDCMTIFGPGNPWSKLGDKTVGGGATIGGFWHFDSMFWGYGLHEPDTCFLMRTEKTTHSDSLGRVKAGSKISYTYRWAMDWGNKYWANFYACTSKVQCLRNYVNKAYDSTYFDGVFIDNVLHFNRQYQIFSNQYWNSCDSTKSEVLLQNAISFFLQKVYAEYHNLNTPVNNPRKILAIGNNNIAYRGDGLWETELEHLDGGMEESFAQTWKTWQNFNDWKKMVYELEYAESQNKICLAHTSIDTYLCVSSDPFSVTWYDTTHMIFAFTSFLMGCDSTSYFSFQGDYQHFFWAPILDVDVGKPTGSYMLREDSLAYRYFEKGIVFCNPSTSEKVIHTPIKNYFMVKPSGDTISVEELCLKPYEGAIFKLR